MSREKVVLAYSGGLDTSIAIRMLSEDYGMDVIAVIVDVGKSAEVERNRQKALKIGAIDSIAVDAKREFVENFVLPALKANALYEGKYPLVSALSRPLISQVLVKIAREKGAGVIAHGCTGKGNDQIRFDTSLGILAPDLKIVAPMREKPMSRDEAMQYADKKGIPVPVKPKTPYSIDENVWGRAIEAGDLEDPWLEPPSEVFALTEDPTSTPDFEEYLEIEFDRGVPISLNDEDFSLLSLIEEVDKVGGRNGFGRIDMIEDRLVGIKSREVYEAPGALSLIKAHQDIESLCLERDLLRYKRRVEIEFSELVYFGLWFSPLKKALDAFIEESQKRVSGHVRLKFYKGECSVTGRRSSISLYEPALATYGKQDEFSHQSAAGFSKLWGLSTKTWSMKGEES